MSVRGAAPATACGALLVGVLLVACGGEGQGGGPPGGRGGGPPGGAVAAVPVEAATAVRREISAYIETNGTLEAENEVDVVARVSAPIVELSAEEGMRVGRGQVLARLDDSELRAQVESARAALIEAEQNYNRALRLRDSQLLSTEAFEQAQTRYETAKADLEGREILLSYTVIRAPFAGQIVARYVDYGQQLSPNTPLFRLSDSEPLLCPIQVPERELSKLRVGQRAHLTVEAWPGERFGARVLRIRPVVDAATGTIKVTLEVDSGGRLRPGMFARVFVETASRADALVVPKTALSLESIGDIVYVVADGVAQRREVELGFREGDRVEIVRGVEAGEQVVVVGQDGLSDGTPLQVLKADGESVRAEGPGGGPPGGAAAASSGGRPPVPGEVRGAGARTGAPERPAGEDAGAAAPGAAGGDGFDPSKMTPEQLERVKERMRARGMTEEQIEERLGRAGRSAGGDG